MARGAHILTAGGGALLRLSRSFRIMADGSYDFADVQAFADGNAALEFLSIQVGDAGTCDPPSIAPIATATGSGLRKTVGGPPHVSR